MSTVKVIQIQHPSAASPALTLDASGNLAFPAGSSSSPAIQGPGDPNTGIFFPAADTIAFAEGGTEALRIDSNGRVGIGTSVPSSYAHNGNALVVTGLSGNTGLTIAAPSTNESQIHFADGTSGIDAYVGRIIYSHTSDALYFTTGAVERFRCDSSGRLLVGTSTAASVGANAPYSLLQVRGNTFSSSGPGLINLQRGEAPTAITSGEEIGKIVFSANDGSEFAIIEALADANAGLGDYPGRLVFSTTSDSSASPSERLRIGSNGNVVLYNTTTGLYPNTDNAVSIGAGSNRWSAVYAANGTIQTSDKRAKTNVADAQLGADFIKSLRPVSYKWVEGGQRDTGERDTDGNFIYESVPGTRTHWGFIAQEVKEAVDAAGVDFGGWVLTDKDDPNSQQALRYDQFIAPLTKALQEALTEIDILKAKVATLEAA